MAGYIESESIPGGKARAITIVASNAVYYAVERRENGEWVTMWEARVDFARDKNHRPGGHAFQVASREQDYALHQQGK